MAKAYGDKKLQLGEPVATMLKDFCAANYGTPALRIIREAVKEHIERRLEEPGMRQRYEAQRKARLGLPEKIVKLAAKDDGK